MPVWPGDDLFGLQAALWRAGARQMVGALWNADVGAASLMAQWIHQFWLSGASAPEAVFEGAKRLVEHRPLYEFNHEWATFVAAVFGCR